MLTITSRVLGPSRCFPFWQELLGCYVVNSADEDGKGKAKCGPALEDYYECLHHKKEVRLDPSDRRSATTQLGKPERKTNKALPNRLPGRGHCKLRTETHRTLLRERARRAPGASGVWEHWATRRIPTPWLEAHEAELGWDCTFTLAKAANADCVYNRG